MASVEVYDRYRGGQQNGFLQWIAEWWKESFYGLMAFACIGLIILPLLSIPEDRVNGEYPAINYKDITATTNEARTLAQLPVDTASLEKYFNALFAIEAASVQCRLLHVRLPYVFVDTNHPCLRFEGEASWLQNELFNKYHYEIGPQRFAELANAYYDLHPDRRNGGSGPVPIVTVFRWEKLFEAYRNGAILAFVFFLFRIREKGCRLKPEFVRLPVMVMFWPGTFWFYPGDPLEQAREIQRWCGCVLSTLISLFGAGAKLALAENVNVVGGGSFQSAYVLNNGKPFVKGVVFQPWINFSFENGLYVGSWASVDLEHSHNHEIDFTTGWRWKGETVSTTVEYAFYYFPQSASGIHAPKATSCVASWSLCGSFQYLAPDNGMHGMQFGVWRSDAWDVLGFNLTTTLGIFHTRGVFETKPITVVKPEISVPLPIDGLKAFVRAYFPLNRTDEGNDQPQWVTGITFAF